MKLIDLSHTIEPGMSIFGDKLPQPEIRPWMSHQQAADSGLYQGCTCEITQASFVTSIGTYLDSPYHFHKQGLTIDQLALSQLVLPGVVFDCTHLDPNTAIPPEIFRDADISGMAVLFHTGRSRYWQSPEYHEFPYISETTAHALREGGAKLVGVDCLIVDNPQDPRRPAHVTLLGADILIVENLTNLSHVPSRGFTFHAVPVKVAGAAAFPVRAYAVVM